MAALADAGYAFPQVAGAIVPSLIAALQAAGAPVDRLSELALRGLPALE